MNPPTYGQLIYYRGGKNIQWKLEGPKANTIAFASLLSF